MTRAAGCPEVHALYHAAMGVQPDRAAAAAPLVLALGKRGAAFYPRLEAVPCQYRKPYGRVRVWAAWIRHLAAKLALAPFKGHPAEVYQQLGTLRYWTTTDPGEILKQLQETECPGLEELEAHAAEAARLGEALRETLLGPAPAAERARTALAAAERLVEMTERV